MTITTSSRARAIALLAFTIVLLGAARGAMAQNGVFAVGGDGAIVPQGPPANLCVVNLPSAQSPPPDFGFISYTLSVPLTFAGITDLSAEYEMQTGCFGGGSPRFQVRIDYDNDTVISAGDRNVFIYWGTHPNFTDCPVGWNNTGNLIASPDLRYDLSSVGGAFYSTHTDAVNLVGTYTVLRVSVVVDGGFTGDQVALVDAFTVNSDVFDSCCDCDDGITCNGAEVCNPTTELCEPGPPLDCSDGDPCTYDTCDEVDGCSSAYEPNPTCRPAGGGFGIKNNDGSNRDSMKWKWSKGPETLFEEFGDPLTETAYDLCIYDYTAGVPAVAGHLTLAPGSAWYPKAGTQWFYRDNSGASDGFTRAKMRSGKRPRIALVARGLNMPTPPPADMTHYYNIDPLLTVQLTNSANVCWYTDYDISFRNSAVKFKTRRKILVQ